MYKIDVDNIKDSIYNGKPVKAYLEVQPKNPGEEPIIINDDNYLSSFDLEKFRYIPDEGFIGGCVYNKLVVNFINVDNTFNLEDRELKLYIGLYDNEKKDYTYIFYGTYIVQKPQNENTTDNSKVECADYMVKFNQPYVDRVKYPTTVKALLLDICDQLNIELGTTSFANENFVIENNQFVGGESYREVLKAIAMSAFSWARIKQDVLYLDFEVKNDEDIVETITNDYYYQDKLKLQDTMYGPVNRVVMGMTDIDGESEFVEDKDLQIYPLNKNICPSQFDYWESGDYSLETGEKYDNLNRLRIKQLIPIPSNSVLYFNNFSNNIIKTLIRTYDINKNFVKNRGTVEDFNNIIQFDSNERYIGIIYYHSTSQGSMTYEKYQEMFANNEIKPFICLNSEENKEFEAFETNGVCEIVLNDNPFAYTEEKRRELVQAGKKLFGLKYFPLEAETIGFIYLDSGDFISVVDMQGVPRNTYILDYTIKYNGAITDKISSPAKTNAETKYLYTPELGKTIKRTEYRVDRAEQTITSVVEKQEIIDSEFNGIKDDLQPLDEVEGKVPLQLKKASNKEVIQLKLYGSTSQKTTSGKNLFNINTLLENQIDVIKGTLKKDLYNKSITIKSTGDDCYISNTWHMSKEPSQNQINGVNRYGIPILPNTKYTWSFDVSNLTGTGSQYMFFYDENYVFLYLKSISVNKNGRASITIETEANVKYVCFRFGLSKTGYVLTVKNVQFEKGEVSTEYEPYTGNKPSPSPDYPQEIKNVKGYRNLFDKEQIIIGKAWNNTTNKDRAIIIIKVKANKTYTFSFGNNNFDGIYWCDCEDGKIGINPTIISTNYKQLIPKYNYLLFQFNKTDISTNDFENIELQLVEGNQEKPYAPYGSNYLELKANSENLYYGTNDIYKFSSTVSSWFYVDGSSNAQGSNVGGKTLYKAPVKKGKNYIFSASVIGTGITNMSLVYGNEQYIYGSSNIWENYSFVAQQDGYVLLRLYINSGNDIEISNVQLIEGNTVKPYTEYQENSTLVNLQNNEICEGDTLIVQNGYASIDKNKKILELTGEENWVVNEITSTYSRYTLEVSDVINASTTESTNKYAYSNYFLGQVANIVVNNTTPTNEVCVVSNKRILIKTDKAELNTLSKWKQFLKDQKANGTPVVVQYELATNEQISLGECIFETIKGDSFVTNSDSANMYVKYYRDVDANNLYQTVDGMREYYTKNETKTEILQQTDSINFTVSEITKKQDTISDEVVSIQEKSNELEARIDGLTNTTSTTGGNNLLKDSIMYNNNKDEYWEGNIEAYYSTEILNETGQQYCILVQNGTTKQTVQVKNGYYSLGFMYKKVLEASEVSLKVNEEVINLTETEFTSIERLLEAKENHITIEITSNADNSAYIGVLMLNIGAISQPWSPNASEVMSDTVKIGKGIEVISGGSNISTRIDFDGNRVINNSNGKVVNESTDKGGKMEDLEVRGKAQISGVLHQKVGNQVWLSVL